MSETTRTAKARGIMLLKAYGALYVVLVALYVFHSVTGAVEVEAAGLKAGDRLWGEFTFEYNGARVMLDPGTAINPLTLDALRDAPAALAGTVELYKPGAFYNLNWSYLLGVWNVLGLGLALYTLLGDPLPTYLDAEREKIAAELKASRGAKADAEALERQHRDMLKDLEQERVRIGEVARDEAAREKARIVTEAQADAGRMLDTLRHHIDASVGEAAKRLARDVAKEAIAQVRAEFSAEDAPGPEVRRALQENFVARMEETTLS